MTGPGKYDQECTMVRTETDAELVLLAVINGKQGSGFSVQAEARVDLRQVPRILRLIANQIEADAEACTSGDGRPPSDPLTH